MYEIITDVLHHELDVIEEKFDGGAKLSVSDLEMIDKIVHSLKCLASYEAMREPKRRRYEEYRRY